MSLEEGATDNVIHSWTKRIFRGDTFITENLVLANIQQFDQVLILSQHFVYFNIFHTVASTNNVRFLQASLYMYATKPAAHI